MKLYIVSGGEGTSATLLTGTALAQFPDVNLKPIIFPHVRTTAEIDVIVTTAAHEGAMIVHTLVDETLRQALIAQTQRRALVAIDLMGSLLRQLSDHLHQEPVGQPGRYRQQQEAYFKRVEAIEFTIKHDDSTRTEHLAQADLVLVGVSRVGKTPLSMYLAVTKGLKVANVALTPIGEPPALYFDPPAALFTLEPGRTLGLTIHPDRLITHRTQRQSKLMTQPSYSAYTDRDSVREEVRVAVRLFEEHHWPYLDITGKPIEESAEEILTMPSIT